MILLFIPVAILVAVGLSRASNSLDPFDDENYEEEDNDE
tara:strand:- start:16 stop:132 length:117 start_codon:yes stop_codon:yes gene_type:complete